VPRISETGNAQLGPAPYMAALAASRHNPVRRAFYERLVALMRRQRTWDPAWTERRPA
jgi:hypothetical protein